MDPHDRWLWQRLRVMQINRPDANGSATGQASSFQYVCMYCRSKTVHFAARSTGRASFTLGIDVSSTQLSSIDSRAGMEPSLRKEMQIRARIESM